MAEAINSLGSQLLTDVGVACPVAPPAEVAGEAVPAELSSGSPVEASAIPLVRRLCEALRERGVNYCHWKSNWRLARWLTGEGDLDLLVDERDAGAFTGAVSALGFKQVFPTRDRQVPGVLDFYGFDAAAERFVHLHVHYRLVLGHDLTKNFHLPLEKPFLESCDRRGLVPVPSADFELIFFVLRMVLKYAPSETALRGLLRPRASGALERELAYLEARASREQVRAILKRHLPFVGVEFFGACLRSLRGGDSAWRRVRLRQQLERRLEAHARRSLTADALLKCARRVTRAARERVFRQSSRKRLAQGGALVALVGGDGAGKTTSLKELHGWLSKKFVVRRFHVGRPPRSPLTLAVICGLRLRRLLVGKKETDAAANGAGAASFPGYLQLLRWVCAARDRRRLYVRARRFASGGGVALCDRFPVEQLRLMDGPNIARTVAPARRNRLVRLLLDAETRGYEQMMPPDLLFVLRVHPDIAVRRKTDESEAHVRTRSRELWEQDWRGTRAHVVDASAPAAEVAAHLKAVLWEKL